MLDREDIGDLRNRLAVAEQRVADSERAEDARRRSEELRRIALESGGMGAWRWDLRHETLQTDGVVQSLWGISFPDQTLPVSIFADLMNADGLAWLKSTTAETVGPDHDIQVQIKVATGPAKGRWIQIRGRAERDSPWIINGVSFDITGQRLAEDNLQGSESRFQQFAQASASGLWIRRADTLAMEYTSPAISAIYGMEPDGLLGDMDRWADLIVPEDRTVARQHIEEARQGRTVVHEFRIRRPSDAAVRWIRNTDFPLLDGRQIQRIGGIAEDITEAKLVQEELQHSNERLRSAVEVGQIGLWDWDIKTNETHWSDEHYRMQGFAVGEVEPSYEEWLKRVHPEDRNATEDALRHAMAERLEYVREFRTVYPNGSIHWHSGRGRFFYNEDREPVRMIGAIIDTTERRDWEDRQKVLVAELQHRVRNILTIVRSVFQRTVEADGPLDQMIDHFAGRLDNLARTQVIVTQNARGAVDLHTLIFDELLSVGFAESPNVSLNGPEVELGAKAAESIGLAIHELTVNAVKYGALKISGATLTITWYIELDNSDVPNLHFTWSEQGVPAVPLMPTRYGFGSELIKEALPYRLGAETKLEFRGGGARCTISMPLTEKAASAEPWEIS